MSPRPSAGIVTRLEKEYGWALPDFEVDGCLEEKRPSCSLRGEKIELIWRNLDKSAAETQAEVFVGQGDDLIVAFEDQSIAAAQKATVESQTPIVFLHPNDPVRDGLVDSLANGDESHRCLRSSRPRR